MIYFFHHYELPAILQQIRIQEMLLQNQQAGQANQTALQDNLNNNHSAAAVAPEPGSQPGPPSATQPRTDPLPPSSSSSAAGGGGEVRAELNWVAQTAAIITEALASSVQQSPAGEGGSGGGVTGGPAAGEVNMVAEFWMEDGGAGLGSGSGATGDEDPNAVSVEIKTTAGGATPLHRPPDRGLQMGPSEAGGTAPAQTDCLSSQSPGTDWDCRLQQSSSQTPS